MTDQKMSRVDQEILATQRIIERSIESKAGLGPYESTIKYALQNWDDGGGGGLRWAARTDPVKGTPGQPAEILGVMLENVLQEKNFGAPYRLHMPGEGVGPAIQAITKALANKEENKTIFISPLAIEDAYPLGTIMKTLRDEGHVILSKDKTEATMTPASLAHILHSTFTYAKNMEAYAKMEALRPEASAAGSAAAGPALRLQ